jgi:1,2-dihydroxy-3-keto-5-methylthiopentene dioxygenase
MTATRLRIFDETNPDTPRVVSSDHAEIARLLGERGVRFERWGTRPEIKPGDAPEQVIAAYRPEIDRLMTEQGYQAVDVVSLNSDHPQKDEFRRKFLDEHTHAEDEVRFFVAGAGLFTLHLEPEVCEVLCTAGDLIGVAAGPRHWFDMGPNPHFVAVRLFTNPAGWVANFTGTDLAARFPRLAN